MSLRPIHLLVNPASGSGRARAQLDRAYAALRTVGPVELVESTRARDETRLAMQAAQANARALVVLGGDGSVSHAARGLIAAKSMTPLVIFAAGTGNDFAKSLGIPSHDFLAMARLIEAGRTRVIDAGEIDGVPFVNSAGFGIDVDVVQRMLAASDRSVPMPDTLRYLASALKILPSYRGIDARVSSLREHGPSRWLTIVFANGRYFGGTFQIAPQADLSDGALDIVAIGNASLLSRVSLLARATRGAHIGHRAVATARATDCSVETAEQLHYQADGELHFASSRVVRVRCLPKALRVSVGN